MCALKCIGITRCMSLFMLEYNQTHFYRIFESLWLKMFKTGGLRIRLKFDQSGISWEYTIVLNVRNKPWHEKGIFNSLNLLSKYKIKKGVFLYVCPDRF